MRLHPFFRSSFTFTDSVAESAKVSHYIRPQPHTPTYTMFEQLSWHVVNPIGLPTFRLRIALSISSRTIGSLQFISFFDESDCCTDLSRQEFTEVDRP